MLFFCRWFSRVFIISMLGVISTVHYSSSYASGVQIISIRLADGSTKQVSALTVPRPSLATLKKKFKCIHQRKTWLRANLASRRLPTSYYHTMTMPVLDQGVWGTCATFASTIAIDELLGLHDNQAVSQLCHLELSRALDSNNTVGSWDGADIIGVLNQIEQYGYINYSYQYHYGCGGLKSYPINSHDNGQALPIDLFLKHSIRNQFRHQYWQDLYQDQLPLHKDPVILAKEALHSGKLLVIGLVLSMPDLEFGMGEYKGIKKDAWVMTPAVMASLDHLDDDHFVGHAMVVTGYDDHACAYYSKQSGDKIISKKECGLFKLRNSWSSKAGDQGDFYVSYDYFRVFSVELVAIGK